MKEASGIAWAGLAALAVAMGIGRFAFTPILPMMQQDAGLTVAGGGWLASANYLGYFVGALWAGASHASRLPPATAIRGGLLAIGLATLAMAWDAGFAAWIAWRAIAGVASAWVLVHAAAWSMEQFARAGRPLLNGVFFAGVGAGIVLAGTLCAVLLTCGSTSTRAWQILALVAFALTVAVWPVFDSARAPAHQPGAGGGWTWPQSRLVIAYGAYGFGYIIPATFLPVMARAVAPDPAVFGWAWPVFGAAAVISTLAVAPLSSRYGSRAAWIGSQCVMAFGVAAPVFLPGIAGILLAALCVGGTFVVLTMVGMQEARKIAGARAPKVMAAMTAAFAAGQIIGPLCVGAMAGAGGFTAALLLACAVLLAGAGTLLIKAND